MAKAPRVVPVFMPPLAAMLARAEELKGGPLTESEVVRIRDHAPCVTMQAEDAEKLIETRGYRDVNPENCWADWHRLRAQMTGKGYLPKIVLCVPGDKDFPKACAAILAEAGNEHEWRKREKGMAEAFAASEFRANPSLGDDDREQIEKHKSVLYVLSKNFTAGQAPDASLAMLRLGRRLLEAGGIAVKCDSSGIAHSKARGIELAKQVEHKDARKRWSALFDAFVQYPIGTGADFYTCGMHLLGKPDLIVGTGVLSAADAVALFGAFALYLLAECAEGEFASGHTFSAGKKAPRYSVVWEPCTGYDEDDFFFNPFGRWRFTPENKP